jgi:hypothetical protein
MHRCAAKRQPCPFAKQMAEAAPPCACVLARHRTPGKLLLTAHCAITELLRSQPSASKTKPPQVQRYDDAVAGGAKRIACATRLSYALYPAWPDGGRTR